METMLRDWDSTYDYLGGSDGRGFVCRMYFYMSDDTGVQIQRDGRKMGRVSSR